jgi:hypothetical protein
LATVSLLNWTNTTDSAPVTISEKEDTIECFFSFEIAIIFFVVNKFAVRRNVDYINRSRQDFIVGSLAKSTAHGLRSTR